MEATASALVKLEDGQRTKARIQTVSVTGGLLRLARALGEGDFVEVAFQTQSGPVHGMAEMLHPRRISADGILQPFRFIALDDNDHKTLSFRCDFDHGAQLPARLVSTPSTEKCSRRPAGAGELSLY